MTGPFAFSAMSRPYSARLSGEGAEVHVERRAIGGADRDNGLAGRLAVAVAGNRPGAGHVETLVR